MSGKMRKMIFVVDDDEMLSIALEDYLSRKTMHKVHLFATGEDCLKHLKEEPDIIILDYNLNSVFKDAANGMQILESIKKLDKAVKVIMLSSQEVYSIALKTVAKGATDYVIKDENAFENIASIIEAL